MEEIWKDVRGFENIYQISNKGNLRSLERYIIENNTNKKRLCKSILIKPIINNNGYYEVCLINEKKEKKHFRVHRLVADAFIDNPDNLPIINHKDKNKLNNKVENLEWCTYKYNNTYKRVQRPFNKPVKVKLYDKNMNYIKTFGSMRQAEREFDVSRTAIRYCCLGINKTCRGHIWRYADE